MKKLFIVTFLYVFMNGVAFAGVNEKALKKFNDTYTSATDAQWSSEKDYSKVVFLNNGQRMEVYYDITGEPIALCRYITNAELPASSLQTIREKYPSYDINDVIQYESATDGLRYYVKMADYSSGRSKVVAVSSQGNVSVLKRARNTPIGQPEFSNK